MNRYWFEPDHFSISGETPEKALIDFIKNGPHVDNYYGIPSCSFKLYDDKTNSLVLAANNEEDIKKIIESTGELHIIKVAIETGANRTVRNTETLETFLVNIHNINLKLNKKLYKHYKGSFYTIIGTDDKFVYYRNIYDYNIWARPFDTFFEYIDIEKGIRRFEPIY